MTSKPLTFMNESILLEALEWYQEIAESAQRNIDSSNKATVLHALIVELSLDGGRRATEAIKKWEDSSGKETGEWQLCPKCNGQGLVGKPPFVSGDLYVWTSGEALYECDVCNGKKIILRPQSVPPYKEEVDKEDELWNEVMQEFGFYSSQLDNIKSKFALTRKI